MENQRTHHEKAHEIYVKLQGELRSLADTERALDGRQLDRLLTLLADYSYERFAAGREEQG